jgi:hypothetical protein
MNATSNVRPAEPFESEATIELASWDRHADPNWITNLAASLLTLHQTMWERKPQVVAESDRKVHVSFDGYAHEVEDANEHAEILLRRHTPLAGLMEGSCTITVISKRRP